MLFGGLLAGVELGLNRVLQMDSTARPRLARLSGQVIAIDCQSPALRFYLLPSAQGIQLASHWESADCTLRAPASSLLKLAFSAEKTAILHSPEVELDGNSEALLTLSNILQDLELDWEYEISRWLGPVGSQLVSGHLRSRFNWVNSSASSVHETLADYLAEESRTLVGEREAQSRFAEIDELKIALERLEARFERLAQHLNQRP